MRRKLGTKEMPWGSKMPVGYIAGIMDAAADGMSMAIRLKSAGCTIHTPAENGGGRKGRKRANTGAGGAGGGAAAEEPPARPNYCNALDFGRLYAEDTENEGDDHQGSSSSRGADVVDLSSVPVSPEEEEEGEDGINDDEEEDHDGDD